MDNIKNSPIIKFFCGKDIKTKAIKLAIVLATMFLTFYDWKCGYLAFTLCAVFIVFEFSADSIFWLVLMAIFVPHINIFIIHMLMVETIIVLLTKLIIDICKNKIDYKNWRFITLICLYFILCLLILLPLSTTYDFVEHAKRLLLFTTVLLGVFYVKQINIKHMLILFTISVVSLCALFLIAMHWGGVVDMGYLASYSNGIVKRFGAFCNDPNFTGAILICAISSWFIAYKKEFINKYLYFIGLGVLGYFGLWTISKATCLIIAIFGLYVVVENVVITIKAKNPKHLLELLCYAGILVLACGIGWKYVDALWQRIFHPGQGWWSDGETGTSISNLTTGRTDLWMGYLNEIFGNPRILFWGSGANSGYVGPGASHSMPIAYLYKYGIIAVLVMLAIFIISALPYLKKAKPYNFVPLVMITGIFCSIGSISAKYIYLFTIVFLTLCVNGIKSAKAGENKIAYEKDIKTKDEQKN